MDDTISKEMNTIIEMMKYQDRLNEIQDESVETRKHGRNQTILGVMIVILGNILMFLGPWLVVVSIVGLVILMRSTLDMRKVYKRHLKELDEISTEVAAYGEIKSGNNI